ncbi:MAG: AAA family ATPase, partial [Thermoplasmata archaeon]
MIDRPVALSGPPGSGKTTAARAVARELKLEIFSAGERFRAEAARQGMGLTEFSFYAGTHPEIDRALDEAMLAQARPGVLVEGRVQGALLRARAVPVHWLSVTAAFEVRVGRVASRDGIPPARAAEEIRGRETSERARYQALYQ